MSDISAIRRLLLHYHVSTPDNNNNNMGDLYNNHFGGAVGSKGEFRRNYLKVVTLAALSLLTQHPSPTFRTGLNTPNCATLD